MKLYVLIVFATVLFSCKTDHSAPAESATANKPVIAQRQNAVCDTDFDTFFKKFSTDSVFQKQHIKFPLKHSHLDNDYENFVRDDMPESKYQFMDFASHKDGMKQEYDKYTVEITKQKDSVAYLMKGYDNGIMINITFSFINGCWYLTAIEDAST